MQQFVNEIESLIGTKPENVRDALKILKQRDKNDPIHDSIKVIIQKLELEDLLEIADSVFQCSDGYIYHELLISSIISHEQRSFKQYDQLKETENNSSDPILTRDEFTSLECATISEYLADLISDSNVELSDECLQLIYNYALEYFNQIQEKNIAVSGFFYTLATNIIIKWHKQKLEQVLLITGPALNFVNNQIDRPSSNMILFLMICQILPIAQEEKDEITLKIINISKLSREFLLSVLGAYCHICTDLRMQLPKEFGHLLLGQNQKISSGVNSFIGQLAFENEYADMAPAVLIQFFILQAKSDIRVAKLIGQQISLQTWLDDLMNSKNQVHQKLAIEFGKILIKCGSQGTQEEWAINIMKIINSQGGIQQHAVDTDVIM